MLKVLMKMIMTKIGLKRHMQEFVHSVVKILIFSISREQSHCEKAEKKDVSLIQFNVILDFFFLNGNYTDGLIKSKQGELNKKV